MSSFLKKIFGMIVVVLIFIFSTKNILAVCIYEGLDFNNNPVTNRLQTGESMCWADSNLTIEKLHLQNNEGTELWECQNDGNWLKKTCTSSIIVGLVPVVYGDGRCLESIPSKKAACISSPTKSCTFSDGRKRNADGTLCGSDGNVYRCDGYQGNFFKEMCEGDLKCAEDTKTNQAQCKKSQCSHEGVSRSVGESACFREDKKRIGQCTGDGFYGGFNIKDCGGSCIQISNTYADCVEKGESFCSSGDIYRKKGWTACIDNKVMVCTGSKFELSPNGDCTKKGQRCDTTNAGGTGACVDLNKPASPFSASSGGGCVCDASGYVTTNNCDANSNFVAICDIKNKSCNCTAGKNIARTNAFCPNFGPGTTNPQIDTALGCIPIETGKFITWLLPFVFGIAGGIAFLLMVYGFILMTFSGGDPKKVQGAKETVTSAIVGLLISVFALFILRLITTDILKIPGIN